MTLADIVAGIPYLRGHGLSVDQTDGGVLVCMPMGEDITNHVGTVHAGAMYTAAETAAGVAAFSIVPDQQAYVLLRGAEVRYTRRAEGDVSAVAHVAAGEAASALAAFEDGGRADAKVEVSATDPEGETVFEGTFAYALRPRRRV